jgi:hypothetical protein
MSGIGAGTTNLLLEVVKNRSRPVRRTCDDRRPRGALPYRTRRPQFCRAAAAIAGDRALAEDAVQDAFAKAWRKRSSYRDPPFPKNPELSFFLVFAGTFDIIIAISTRHEIEVWWLQLIGGIVELALGFWAAGYYGRSATLLIAWVAAFAIIRGVRDIVLAFRVR